MSLREISLHETAQQLGLTAEETEEIARRLGRPPTLTELSMLSVEWSEHCSYRRTRRFFSKFPRTGAVPVLVGEDAGGIVLEDLAVVFKVESHNHPSQVEPKHGAATGVGGIIRDILSAGARPAALLNSLRFGPPDNPQNRRLLRGVVEGISWYGNSIGVPTVGGEIDFHPSYAGNSLVNVACIGIAKKDELLTSGAKPGKAVMILGARTGRDGIGGCSVLASREMRESLSKRPTVQVGDPYFGKCLMEAVLEAASKKLFTALKDMGAAGLTCTTGEMSAAGGCGMEIDTAKIPAREKGMEPWEFMMSESQERMLATADFARTREIREIFHRWGLEAEVIGQTVPEPVVQINDGSRRAASLSTQVLTQPPLLSPAFKNLPRHPDKIHLPEIPDFQACVLKFLALPSLASKKWAFRQYDSTVRANTAAGPGGDAAVIRVPGKPWGIAAVTEGNGRYCKIDPRLGAQYVAEEAARNLVCVGARPLAVSDGLNFGNPDKPESFGEFVEAVEGLALACRELGLPVVSGNVSLYNETEKGRILPTPILLMVGQIPEVSRIVPEAFQNQGDKIYRIGPECGVLNGCLFLEHLGIESGGLAPVDWPLAKKIHDTILKLHEKNLVASCHDAGQGGLLTALVECAVFAGIGASIRTELSVEELFGETPSRFAVTVTPQKEEEFRRMIRQSGLPFAELGTTGGSRLQFAGCLNLDLNEITGIYENTLPALMI